MSETRRPAVLADIAGRLNAALPGAAAADIKIVATILKGILKGGRSKPTGRREVPRATDAARDFVSARAPRAEADAMDRWITRYLDPTSPHRLDGADALWLRAVNLQRDRDRRRALRPVAGCPTRLALGYEHRILLAKMLKNEAKRSGSDYVGRLVEQSHEQKMTKKQAADKRKAGKPEARGLEPEFELDL
jgi:hypothetical protein